MTAQAYLGAIGRTRTETVHVSVGRGALVPMPVTTSVDAAADPALAEQLRDDALNVVQLGAGELLRIAVPVVYHDPDAGLLVLVLCEAHRHRELDERIRVLEQLRDDPSEVPAYAKDFAVVFGGSELRAYLGRRLRRGVRRYDTDPFEPGPVIEDEVGTGAYAAYDAEPAYGAGEAAASGPLFDIEPAPAFDPDPGIGAELAGDAEPGSEPVIDAEAAADAGPALGVRVALEFEPARDGGMATGSAAAGEAASGIDPAAVAGVVPEAALGAGPEAGLGAGPEAGLEAAPEAAIDRGPAAETALPEPASAAELALDAEGSIESEIAIGGDIRPGGDPPITEITELPVDLEGEAGQGDAAPGWHLDDAGVHLAIEVDEALSRELAGSLDLRLVLYRTQSAPVIALVLGAPAAFRAARPSRLAVAVLDVTAERDRGVLRALGRHFELTLEIATAGHWIRRCRLAALLTDNAGYLVRAADDHRRGIAAFGEPDFARAQGTVLGAGFDLLGIAHPERAELRADQLAQIATARQLVRALAIARHFTRPAREDYLVCSRGFPLARWHQLRRDAVAKAVAWGLWMGPELAQIAVSEGFARSRRDLIFRIARGFDVLRHDRRAFDLDAGATADNAAAIAEQARTLGVELRARKPNDTGAIASDVAAEASGSIVAPLPQSAPPRRSIEELLAVLEEGAAGRGGQAQRLAAALALCDRGDPRTAPPVIAAALKMSRGEAVRVLARAVKLGPAAHPALIEGLASSKAYLRHGCALALALSRSDDAAQAVIALLLSEPTELWQEIARAIGEIGAPALVWLVRNVGQHGAAAEERIALAMAHVAARGGGPALTTMAAADSIVSPIAVRALDLLATLSGDHDGAAPAGDPHADRDVGVNRAFSRQFFEALEREAADDTGAELAARDAAPAVVEA